MTAHARHMLRIITLSNYATQHSWITRVWPIFRAVVIVLYLGTLALDGYGLSQVVQTGDWENLWKQLNTFGIGVVLIPAAFLLKDAYFGGAASELVRAFAAIRAAVVHGDERLAPLAANQPVPRTDALEMPTTSLVGPLHGPNDSTVTGPVFTLVPALMGAAAMLVLAVTATIFWFATFGWTTPIISNDPTTDAIIRAIWIGLGVVMLGVLVACVWAMARLVGVTRRARRGMTIAADGHGLAWTETATGKRQRLAWSEASLFLLVADAGGPRLPPLSMHVLLGPGVALVWQTPSPSEAEQWAAHTQLCQRIVAASHLPLRDLSTISAQLAHVTYGAAATQQDVLPELLGRDAGIAVPGVSFERIRALARRQIRMVLALETPYVLLFLAAIVGSILQHFGISLLAR